MQTIDVTTFEALDQWLSDNFDFEDGSILEVKDSPLEIRVGYDVKANYKANSELHILPFKIVPYQVSEWSFDEASILIGEDSCIERIKAVDVKNGICLDFFTPRFFRLVAAGVVIEEEEVVKTIVRPSVNEKEIYLRAAGFEIPKPQFWKEQLGDFGHNIVFRYYSGEELSPDQVPYPDYEGYYIQNAGRSKSAPEGILLCRLRIENGKLMLVFVNRDNELREIWRDLTIILSNFTDAVISSGNCEFTGSDWRQYLLDNKLPTEEFGSV